MSVPLSRPPVDDEIKAAVLAAIDSRQYILGPECRAFEQEFARYIGVKHAALTSSATAAQVSPRTVGFVPVHLYGHPADLDGILRLCSERSLWLLEDCAQAHGAA